MRWMVLGFALLAACGSKKEKEAPPTGASTAPSPTAAPVDAAGAAASSNPLGLDPKVVAELRALGKARSEQLAAAAPRLVEFPPQPEDPTGCCGATRSTVDIAALGACTRPTTDAAKQALLARVDAFVAKQWPRGKASEPTRLRTGCEEASGIVVDVQALRAEGKAQVRRWWTLRVGPTAVTSIAELTDCRGDDCMWEDAEWAQQTLLLADLDGDGARDPIIRRTGKGSTELDPVYEMLLGNTAPAKLANQLDGGAEIADWQPADADHTVVIQYQPSGAPDPKLGCVTTAGQAATCPPLERELQRQAQELAAGELAADLTGWLFDRDGLADRLAILEVPAPDRERYLAAAAGPPLKALLDRYAAQRDAAMAARGEGKEASYRPAVAAARATELRAATGQLACPPLAAAAAKQRAAAIAKVLTATDRSVSDVEVRGACTSPTGAQVLVAWKALGTDATLQHVALVAVTGATFTPIVEGATAILQTHDGPDLADRDQLPTVELWQTATSVGALVMGPGAKLTAVVDGTITGTRDGPADLAWTTGSPDGAIELSDDGVARTIAGATTTYWIATPAGVTALGAHDALDLSAPLAATSPAGQLLETLDRTERADAFFRSSFSDAELASPAVRDDLLAALTLLGAPAPTLAQVKTAR